MIFFSNPENTNQEVLDSFPKFCRLLAIDVGTKRLGIALSDASRFIATPKFIIHRSSNQKDFEKIRQYILENEVIGVVVGRPIQLDDSLTPMTKIAEDFSKELDIFLENKFPLFLFEERLTSFEAREINTSHVSRKRNKYVDDIAASFILQHFLDYFCQSKN